MFFPDGRRGRPGEQRTRLFALCAHVHLESLVRSLSVFSIKVSSKVSQSVVAGVLRGHVGGFCHLVGGAPSFNKQTPTSLVSRQLQL